MTIKEKMLSLDIIENNEFLDKYVSLIENNIFTSKEKFFTQEHHIIPKCYYKLNNLELDNSKDNKVNLKYIDHALAHLYLANCTNDGQFKHRNLRAVSHVIGNANFKKLDTYEIEKNLITNSKLYTSTYACSRQWWSENCNLHDLSMQSSEIRSMNGKQNAGRKYCYKGNIVRSVHKDEYDKLLAEGYLPGNPNNTKMNSTRKHMYKDDIQKNVKIEDIPKMLSDGWLLGDKPNSNSHKHGCPTRKGISPENAVKVRCVEQDIIYDSLAKAHEATGDNVVYAVKKIREGKPYNLHKNSRFKFTWELV